jgi:excisionase family DNA binding protein
VSEQLLTAAQVAGLFAVSPSTIVDWAERSELPAFKVGGRLRFGESDALNWLEARRLNPRTT